jgi:hypothetical protein
VRGYRKNKEGRRVPIKQRSQAMVEDHGTSPPKRRYFPTYEEASAWAQAACNQAHLEGRQSQDRFYVWCGGDCYSYDVNLNQTEN